MFVVCTRTLAYDPAKPWRLATAALPAFYGSRVLTALYETTGPASVAGRYRGFQVGPAAGSAADLEQTYGFDTAGRFETLTTAPSPSLSLPARTFHYAYTSDAPFVAALSIEGGHPFTLTRNYDDQRDLLAGIEGKWAATTRTRYDYTHNALGQRASRRQSGDVFADYAEPTFTRYTYNPRGEVISAPEYLGATVTDTSRPLSGRQHAFAFDSLGNRQWADRTGDPARREDYTTNALNQITTKKNLTLPVQGTIGASASGVAVSGAPTVARQGRYYAAELAVANATAPWRGTVNVQAAQAGAGPGGADLVATLSTLGQLPQALQTLGYDADGNLLTDGLWDYQWDGENRLVRMETTGPAQAAGFPHRVLTFTHDHLGRRVQKVVQEASGVQWTVVSARRFLYDGWNLVAEFSSSDLQSFSLSRTYTWGLDLTGSLTAAGGVGGLVLISDHTSQVTQYLPTYDGNGNVAALLDAATGVAAATYEYSPFGEPLRSGGAYAKENPFRFSTKFTDDETGLVDYNTRYYSATLGRFINRDTISEQGGLNLYAYVLNNPVNKWDYLGQMDYFDYGQYVYGGGHGGNTYQPGVYAVFDDRTTPLPTYNGADNQWTFTQNVPKAPSSGVPAGHVTLGPLKVTGQGDGVALSGGPNGGGPSVVAVIADAAAGSGLGTIPKPTTGLGAGGLTPTSPASIIARTGLPQTALLSPLPAPTTNNPNIMSTNLGTVAGRVVPVAGVVVAVAVTVTSPNPLRTGVGQTFGFIVGALGGTAGVIASAPTGGLAVPVTATAGALAGSWAGNRLGLSLYDSIAGLSPAPAPQPPTGRPPGG